MRRKTRKRKRKRRRRRSERIVRISGSRPLALRGRGGGSHAIVCVGPPAAAMEVLGPCARFSDLSSCGGVDWVCIVFSCSTLSRVSRS